MDYISSRKNIKMRNDDQDELTMNGKNFTWLGETENEKNKMIMMT